MFNFLKRKPKSPPAPVGEVIDIPHASTVDTLRASHELEQLQDDQQAVRAFLVQRLREGVLPVKVVCMEQVLALGATYAESHLPAARLESRKRMTGAVRALVDELKQKGYRVQECASGAYQIDKV